VEIPQEVHLLMEESDLRDQLAYPEGGYSCQEAFLLPKQIR
jgi:hypothetical protein